MLYSNGLMFYGPYQTVLWSVPIMNDKNEMRSLFLVCAGLSSFMQIKVVQFLGWPIFEAVGDPTGFTIINKIKPAHPSCLQCMKGLHQPTTNTVTNTSFCGTLLVPAGLDRHRERWSVLKVYRWFTREENCTPSRLPVFTGQRVTRLLHKTRRFRRGRETQDLACLCVVLSWGLDW